METLRRAQVLVEYAPTGWIVGGVDRPVLRAIVSPWWVKYLPPVCPCLPASHSELRRKVRTWWVSEHVSGAERATSRDCQGMWRVPPRP